MVESIACVFSSVDLIVVTKPIINVLLCGPFVSLKKFVFTRGLQTKKIICSYFFNFSQVSLVSRRSGRLNHFPSGFRKLSMSNNRSVTFGEFDSCIWVAIDYCRFKLSKELWKRASSLDTAPFSACCQNCVLKHFRYFIFLSNT